MALKATIYKATVSISDMDRSYYDELNLTIAQHPSESDKRMMVRLFAYIVNACEGLEFTKGLSEDSEPEIWHVSYSDEIELWIDLGLPDEKRIKQAGHKSKKVKIYSYGDNATMMWLKQTAPGIKKYDNVEHLHISDEHVEQLTGLIQRTMQLQATIQDDQLWLSNDEQSILVEAKPFSL